MKMKSGRVIDSSAFHFYSSITLSPNGAYQQQQYDGTDKGRDDRTDDAATDGNAQRTKQPATNEGTQDTDQNRGTQTSTSPAYH
jgi:hypothetical protein